MSFHPPTPRPRRSTIDTSARPPKITTTTHRPPSDFGSDFFAAPGVIRPRLEGARPGHRQLPGSTGDLEDPPESRILAAVDRRHKRKQTLPARGSIPHQRKRKDRAQRGGKFVTPRPLFPQPPRPRQQPSSAESRRPRVDTPPRRPEPMIVQAAPDTEASQSNNSQVFDTTNLQSSNVLNDFDSASFLTDQQVDESAISYIDSFLDALKDKNDILGVPTSLPFWTVARKDDVTFRAFPHLKGIVREGMGSRAKHNAPLLLHSTISEDYSNKDSVKRKLFCAMEKTFAPHPFKEGLDRTQFMPTSKAARPD